MLGDVLIAILSAKSAPCEPSSSPVSASAVLQNEEQNVGHLSAWEEWILHKAKEERDAADVKLRKQEEIEKKAKLEQTEREKKKTEAAAKVQTWIEEYDAMMKQKRRLQQKRDKAEQELKEEKKLELLNKAKVNFQVCDITLSVLLMFLLLLFLAVF